jgi:hypothetical protein
VQGLLHHFGGLGNFWIRGRSDHSQIFRIMARHIFQVSKLSHRATGNNTVYSLDRLNSKKINSFGGKTGQSKISSVR